MTRRTLHVSQLKASGGASADNHSPATPYLPIIRRLGLQSLAYALGGGCGLALARDLPLPIGVLGDDHPPPNVPFAWAPPLLLQLVIKGLPDAVGGAKLCDRIRVTGAARRQRRELARLLLFGGGGPFRLILFHGGGLFHLAAGNLGASHRESSSGLRAFRGAHGER